jgi:predicted O-methyltransferase YrrM
MKYDYVCNYVERLVGDGGTTLNQVYRKSAAMKKFGVFSIDPPRGRFLELIARMMSPKKILEIGPGIGYSALWLLKCAGSSATLDAIELNAQVARKLEDVMAKTGYRRRVRIHQGAALEVLSHMKGSFDCVFIDAEKDEYPDYLRQSLRLTRQGSVILADNMFWSDLLTGRERGVRGVREYTKMIFRNKRLSSLIVPLGDGLAVSFRIK